MNCIKICQFALNQCSSVIHKLCLLRTRCVTRAIKFPDAWLKIQRMSLRVLYSALLKLS